MGYKTSINIKPANALKSEAHNERRVKLDYTLASLKGFHEHWKASTISSRLEEIQLLYAECVGQKMQKKSEPVREGVIVIKPNTSLEDLHVLGEKFKQRFGIECFQIHIHRDEGHVVSKREVEVAKAMGDLSIKEGMVIINHHAHMIFDWQDKKTGRSIKLNRDDMREMQTMTAEVLEMERGEENSKAKRLEAQEFKIFKQKLQESASNEIEAINEQKKSLHPELTMLKHNYNQILKELNSSKEELTKWESKFWLLSHLEQLQWNACTVDVSRWLAQFPELEKIKIMSGQDGSIYFQLNEMKARLKDFTQSVQSTIREKLSVNPVLQPKKQFRNKL